MFKVKVGDVKAFLRRKGYNWNGEINGVRVTDDNSDIVYRVSWFGALKCKITPFKFKVSSVMSFTNEKPLNKDWSQEWMYYLLDKYKADYVPHIKRWCNRQKNLIRSEYQQKESLLLRKLEALKQEEQESLGQFKDLEDSIQIASNQHAC